MRSPKLNRRPTTGTRYPQSTKGRKSLPLPFTNKTRRWSPSRISKLLNRRWWENQRNRKCWLTSLPSSRTRRTRRDRNRQTRRSKVRKKMEHLEEYLQCRRSQKGRRKRRCPRCCQIGSQVARGNLTLLALLRKLHPWRHQRTKKVSRQQLRKVNLHQPGDLSPHQLEKLRMLLYLNRSRKNY